LIRGFRRGDWKKVIDWGENMSLPLGFNLFGMGPTELLVIAIIGLLLFGRKLPEVGRYLGKGIVEFKKGMKGLEDDAGEVYNASSSGNTASEPARPPQRITSSAPKLDEPNPSEPPKI
jgi:sec-independent protein translocase protein TatA